MLGHHRQILGREADPVVHEDPHERLRMVGEGAGQESKECADHLGSRAHGKKSGNPWYQFFLSQTLQMNNKTIAAGVKTRMLFALGERKARRLQPGEPKGGEMFRSPLRDRGNGEMDGRGHSLVTNAVH